jgi:zinc protease
MMTQSDIRASRHSGPGRGDGSGPTTYRLANGAEVVFDETHLAPVVAIQAWIKVGAGDEPRGQAGIAHVVEHMLFKGTKRRRVGQIAREIESAGGDINAWTSHDETAFHVVLPKDALALGIDVLADALSGSLFDPVEFGREQQVILEEVRQGLDDPDRMAGMDLFATIFDAHPYGRPVIGAADSVAKLTRADVVAFFRRHYGAKNLTLVVAGDFDSGVARRLIERSFGKMRPSAPCPPRPLQPVQRAPRVVAVSRDIKENQLLLAWRGPRVDDDDVPALDLLSVALGQGESARLHLALVRGQRLFHATSAYMFSGRDPGLVVVTGSLISPRGRAPVAALQAMLAELEKVCSDELSPAEIARSRTLLESQRVFDRESSQGLARKLGFFASTVGDVHFEDQYLRRLADVTGADVRRVAQAYLRRETLTVFAQLEAPAGNRAKAASAGPRSPLAGHNPRMTAALGRVVRSFRKSSAHQPVPIRTVAGTPRSLGAPDADVVSMRLSSGLRLLVLPSKALPLVALRGAWVGGLRHEDLRSNGSSSLVAALLSRGTRGRDAETITREVEGMAASLSGHAGRNSLGLEAEFLTRHLDEGLDLFAECLQGPTFPDSELQHERSLALEALRQQDDDVGHAAFRLFESTLFSGHPYGLDLIGNAQSLPELGRSRLLRFYRERYDPARLTVAAVGDVDPDRLALRMEKLFATRGVRATLPPPKPGAAAVAAAPRVRLREMAREQAHLVLGYPGVTMESPDRFPLEILAQLLSGQGGRLFAEIREKRGLAYSVGAFSLEGLDPGYFAVHAATNPASLGAVLGFVRQELTRIIDSGVKPADLGRAQRHLIGGHAISLQRRSALAAALAFHEAYGLGWQSYRHYTDQIAAVKVADLQRVAQKYWDPRREVVTVVGPKTAFASFDETLDVQTRDVQAAKGPPRKSPHERARR